MKVLAGDFKKGPASLSFGKVHLAGVDGIDRSYGICASVTPLTEANKNSVLAKAGWGVAGAVALGPIGALAGLLGGGNRKAYSALVIFRDGKKVLLDCNDSELKKLMAMSL